MPRRIPIPDPRPSKADPEMRKVRKELEKEHGFAWVPPVLLGLIGVTLAYDLTKEVEKHEDKHKKEEEEEQERRRRRELRHGSHRTDWSRYDGGGGGDDGGGRGRSQDGWGYDRYDDYGRDDRYDRGDDKGQRETERPDEPGAGYERDDRYREPEGQGAAYFDQYPDERDDERGRKRYARGERPRVRRHSSDW